MNPIIKLVNSIMDNKKDIVFKIINDLGINLSNEEKE